MPTITIRPSSSNIKESRPRSDNTFSYPDSLGVGTNTSGVVFRSFIQFELPEIDGYITDAQLLLSTTTGSGSFVNIDMYRVTQPWDEQTVHWFNMPTTDSVLLSSVNDVNSDMSFAFGGLQKTLRDMTSGTLPNYGFMLRSRSESVTNNKNIKNSENYIDQGPALVITYNESPSKPILVEPNGGNSFDQLHSITWGGSTDSENDLVKYQIQLSIDNGNAWKTITSEVASSPFNYNFISETETSQALIRIRAYDGYSYSDWGESDGVFTIQHNVAPTIPTNLSPSGIPIDRLKTRRLAWRHNDSPNDIQSKAEINWRHQGDALWTVLVSDGPDQEYFIPPNTFPNGQTEWRVRTYDASSIVSPWSNVAVFTAAEPTNAPTIIQPTGSVNVARPIVEWTSASQSSYQLVVEDSLGATVWDTGEITSIVKARTVGADLLNGGTYKVKVRIKDGSGLFSSFADRTFIVSYTAPAKPTVQAFPAEGAIAISIDHPTPTGTQPSVLYSDVYREFEGGWIRIATNVNVAFTDYAVASGIEYKYRIQTHGNNGTFSYSDVVSTSVTLKGAWIHAVQDAESTATHFRYNGVGYDTEFTPESVAIKFAGRRRPVIQFGVYEDYSLSVTIQSVDGMDDMNRLRTFVRNRELICYRDSDGNLLYGIIPSLPITKEYRVSSASITIIETEFNEEV